jgi:formate hydrogenlyase subunit 3/multisubunit Na+/H+ antiporter MnhD subunit
MNYYIKFFIHWLVLTTLMVGAVYLFDKTITSRASLIVIFGIASFAGLYPFKQLTNLKPKIDKVTKSSPKIFVFWILLSLVLCLVGAFLLDPSIFQLNQSNSLKIGILLFFTFILFIFYYLGVKKYS